MNPCVAHLLASGAAFAVASSTVLSAQPTAPSSADVEILVDSAPQPRFAHEGRWYVEARKGKEYAIQLRNPYPVRVAVALSVDGLNSIDARQTTSADARKWVLAPYQTVTISGWQTSRAEARRFEFTTEERSYAQALGKADNLGMISAVFYRERIQPIMRERSNESAAPRVPSPRSSAQAAPGASAPPAPAPAERSAPSTVAPPAKPTADAATDEYAATGMGRRTDHPVEQVSLDLEQVPAQTVNIRYEFRAQLVRLGVVPPSPRADALLRRERARGFEPGFSPEPPQPNR